MGAKLKKKKKKKEHNKSILTILFYGIVPRDGYISRARLVVRVPEFV